MNVGRDLRGKLVLAAAFFADLRHDCEVAALAGGAPFPNAMLSVPFSCPELIWDDTIQCRCLLGWAKSIRLFRSVRHNKRWKTPTQLITRVEGSIAAGRVVI